MCVEESQAIVQLRGARKRGFLAKKGHLKDLRPLATACDRLRRWAPPCLQRGSNGPTQFTELQQNPPTRRRKLNDSEFTFGKHTYTIKLWSKHNSSTNTQCVHYAKHNKHGLNSVNIA